MSDSKESLMVDSPTERAAIVPVAVHSGSRRRAGVQHAHFTGACAGAGAGVAAAVFGMSCGYHLTT